MKRILLSLLVIVAAFCYFSAKIDTTGQATAQTTVASSDEVTDSVACETEAEATEEETDSLVAETCDTDADTDADEQNAAEEVPVTDETDKYHLPAYLTDRPEEVITHSSMTLSWNDRLRIPNYVAWQLTPERVEGDVKRHNDFQPDPKVRRGTSTTWADYRGSGFDRGHLCPAADNKHTNEAQRECFYMTNMCPQTHSLNAGDWNQIEELCRKWTKTYGRLYIVAGPIINDYPADKNVSNRIAKSNVAIPDAFFKVVLRRDEDGTKAIGFICPNGTQNKEPRDYVVTVDSVETVTGINFYSKLPKDEERKAEASYSLDDWGMK